MRGRTAFVYIDRPPGGFDADTVLLDDAAARARRSSTCSPTGTGGSPASRTGGGSTPRASASPATRRALAAAGIELDPELIRPGSHDAAHAEVVVSELLDLPADRRPSAIFTANNRNTVGALHALARPRRRRSRWSASTTSSSPTCSGSPWCARDPGRLGARAAALAFARLDGDDRPPQHLTIPTALIARGSGERPA